MGLNKQMLTKQKLTDDSNKKQNEVNEFKNNLERSDEWLENLSGKTKKNSDHNNKKVEENVNSIFPEIKKRDQKKSAKRNLTLRLPEDVIKKLDIEAQASAMSKSQFIEYVVEKYYEARKDLL